MHAYKKPDIHRYQAFYIALHFRMFLQAPGQARVANRVEGTSAECQER